MQASWMLESRVAPREEQRGAAAPAEWRAEKQREEERPQKKKDPVKVGGRDFTPRCEKGEGCWETGLSGFPLSVEQRKPRGFVLHFEWAV